MISRRILAAVAAAALAGWSLGAQASPIQWTLTDVLFEDGGTASGSFIYDADTTAFSAISITTTAGTMAPGAVYTSLVLGTATDAAVVPAAGPNLTGSSLLQLIFQFPLTNAGGTVYLINPFFPATSSFEGSCLNAACTSYDFGRLMVDGGVIGAPVSQVVPVPAAAWLLGSALAVLGAMRRRR